jgi:O-antigen/teichoic acid export membrane protein
MAWHDRIPKRLVVMICSEGMQSALHFGLNIVLLRSLSPRDYGVFAIVMLIGGLGLTYIRALTAMPAAIRIGRSRGARAADAYDVIFGSGAFVLSLLIAVVVAVVLRLWLGTNTLGGGMFVGLWSLRSHIRTAMFARGRPWPVTIGDVVFFVSGALLALGLMLTSGEERLHATFALLAVANALGIGTMLLGSRRVVRISLRRSVRSHYVGVWRQLGWSGVSVTTSNLQGQGFALVVAAMAGPAAYAPIAAVFVFFVPLRLVATALINLTQPKFAIELARGDTARVWSQARDWSAVMGIGALVYGIVVMLALPLLKSQVFEGNDMPVILVGTWVIAIVVQMYVMPRIVLEAVGAFRRIAIITTGAGIVGMSLVAAILLVAPAAWSLMGALVSEAIVLIASWGAMAGVVPMRSSRPLGVVAATAIGKQPG